MEKFTIVFMRHGESEANLNDTFQGQTDSCLTERGKAQVLSLVARWQAEGRHFDAIISSPLLRARQTAEMISNILMAPVEFDPDWLERDTGKLTGMNRQEAVDSPFFLDFFTPHHAMGETGESDFELFLRAGKALSQLLKRPAGNYLVVSHGGILNQVLRAIIGVTPQANGEGATFKLVNTGFAALTYDPAKFRWTITGFNDHAHLNSADMDKSMLD